MTLLLRPLTVDDEQQALAAHEELAPDDFMFLLDTVPGQPWTDYVARLHEVAHGIDLPPDRVPATFLVAEVDGDLVGRISIRHELNDWLARYGGHIGYGVRPQFRRRGYATQMLRRALVIARDVGVDRALLYCDADNVASASTIEACGGVLDGFTPGPEDGFTNRRYWIELGMPARADPALD